MNHEKMVEQFLKQEQIKERARPMIRSLRYKRTYGIPLSGVRKILREQKMRCAICGDIADSEGILIGTGKPLAVDHCHKSGHVRGLLCGHCNSGIGFFRDDPEILLKAIEYLKTRASN